MLLMLVQNAKIIKQQMVTIWCIVLEENTIIFKQIAVGYTHKK
jgi:hypothetical protein